MAGKILLFSVRSNGGVHALGVGVVIQLKIDWQGCNKVLSCQILHLIGQWD